MNTTKGSNQMDAQKKQKISLRILALVAAGMPIRSAIDQVLGAGTSAEIIGSVYESMKAVR